MRKHNLNTQFIEIASFVYFDNYLIYYLNRNKITNYETI